MKNRFSAIHERNPHKRKPSINRRQ